MRGEDKKNTTKGQRKKRKRNIHKTLTTISISI